MMNHYFTSSSIRRDKTIDNLSTLAKGSIKRYVVTAVAVWALCTTVILRGQSPGGISTSLKAWYKADVGASTTAWTNQVTNAALPALSKAGAGTITLNGNNFNFNPSLSFSNAYFGTGSTNNVPMAALTNGSRVAIYAVGKISASGVVVGFQDQTSITNKLTLEDWGMHFYGTTSTSGGTFPNAGLVGTVPKLVTGGYGTTTINAYTNGTSGAAVASNNNNTTSRTFNIMSFRNGSYIPTGDLAEVIIYDATHTQAEREKVQTYLAIKYGITLSHNYQNSAGTVVYNIATMPYEIAGIGQDNGSGLLQKQSASVADTSLQIALTSFAGSNAANSNAFAADLTAMMWGHNGLSKTKFTSPLSNDATLSRMSRTWKVQETLTVGTNKIRSLATQYGSAPYLIVSSDSTFATYTKVAMTLNGSFYEADYDLNNNTYFTFAQTVARVGGVSGATLWLKADAGITKTGANITTWADQSKSGNITTQPTKAASANVTYVSSAINHNPSVRFDGTANQRLVGAASTNFTGAGTYIAVANIASASISNIAGIIGNTTEGGQGLMLVNYGASGPMYYGTDGSGAYDPNSSVSANIFSTYSQPRIARSVYNAPGTSTQNTSLYLDGGVLGTTYSGAGVSIAIGSGFEIGGRTPGGNTARIWNGNISEVVYYPSVLNATQLNQVESYLALKYGITLGGNAATTASYVLSDGSSVWSANSGYHYNVAGIGRDSASALDQRQSTSVTATFPTFGNTAIASDNASNANAFANDKAFDIWGHNNGATTTTAISGTGLQPMARVWRMQETGTVGSVQVRVPNTIGTLASGEKWVMIVSSDATIGTSDTRIDLTANGSNYEGAYDFATGVSYFTFAKVATTEGALCSDGIDNDADGATDCNDSECGIVGKTPAIRH